MNFDKKTVTIHGGKKRIFLTPCETNSNIIAGHDNKGFVAFFGNGSGYQSLKECFCVAACMQEGEILQLPISFKQDDLFKTYFNYFDFCSNIFLVNYCETQILPKEIAQISGIKVFTKEKITRSVTSPMDFVDHWKTVRRLTVKLDRKNMIIVTNRDGFHNLAMGANQLEGYGDDVKYNDGPPHYHFDWQENTSKSVGITLYYWQNEILENH